MKVGAMVGFEECHLATEDAAWLEDANRLPDRQSGLAKVLQDARQEHCIEDRLSEWQCVSVRDRCERRM
jgi:hypothetical protein